MMVATILKSAARNQYLKVQFCYHHEAVIQSCHPVRWPRQVLAPVLSKALSITRTFVPFRSF